MALPQQLKTARMTDATLGVDIDNNVGALELAIADILGFTTNTDVTESPFGCDNSGRLTKALIRQVAAGPVGFRFRDSTSGKEFRLATSGTNVVIDENTGTEAVPVWTNRASLAIATGVWTFTGIPVGPASDPTTANQLVRKAYADALIATAVLLTGNQTVAGIKTFSSFPVTPSSAPTTDYQVANRKFVTDNLPLAANQAEMEAGTGLKFVTPEYAEHHPSACKAWAMIRSIDGVIMAGYNVDSVTRSAEGQYIVYWTTDFSATLYAVLVTPNAPNPVIMYVTGSYADRATIEANTLSSGWIDPTYFYVAAYGDQ